MHVQRNDLNMKNRMKGDFHVRFREGLRVKFLWSTRQRFIRPLVGDRKNSLFFGSDRMVRVSVVYHHLHLQEAGCVSAGFFQEIFHQDC